MIANKERVGVFLRKLDRLCKRYGANIEGNVAFFDPEVEGHWSDWLALTCNGERASVKYKGPDEDGFDPEVKLEEIHKDLLTLRSEVLQLTELQCKKRGKKAT